MNAVIGLIKGFTGKPSHPPLTDASIGAYTVGVAMLVLGALGVEEEQMSHGALLAIGGGLALALPTALTGLLDWLDIPRGTPLWRTATLHMVTMLTATAVFAATWVYHLEGYKDDTVETLSWILGAGALGLLTMGGYLGGTIVYVYGMRVLGRHETPTTDALVPGHLDETSPASPGESDSTGQATERNPTPH